MPGARGTVGAGAAAPGDLDAVVIRLGPEETVFAWKTDRCEDLDVPDTAARAIRRPNGIVLFATNAPRNYLSHGADFTRVRRSCTPILASPDDWNAGSFQHQWWIASVYSTDGNTIHALVHNEYHDPRAPNCRIGDTTPRNPCWYNAIVYAVSRDGGRSFQAPPSPDHLVAAPPHRWDPGWGGRRRGRPGAPPYGYFEPTNIVRGPDGAFYSIFFAIVEPGSYGPRGTCLMRTTDLAAPSSWRLWDGQAFTIAPSNPYTSAGAAPCAFIGLEELDGMRGSLTYNRYLGRYMLVGTAATRGATGSAVCGIFYSLSEDLITWSMRRLLKAGPLPWCKGEYTHDADMYPSIIDHADTTVSFERAGRTPYLYFTRMHRGLHRDLLRIPLTITRGARPETTHRAAAGMPAGDRRIIGR